MINLYFQHVAILYIDTNLMKIHNVFMQNCNINMHGNHSNEYDLPINAQMAYVNL